MEGIDLYLLDVNGILGKADEYFPFIPSNRVEKVKRYLRDKDKALSVGAALLVEEYVGRGPYIIEEGGKPYKEGRPFFSISHTWSYAILGVSSFPIGVDMEKIKEVKGGLIDYAFTIEEKEEIESDEDFYLSWSAKEAASKCIGTGLLRPQEQGLKLIEGHLYSFLGQNLYIQKTIYDGNSLAIAMPVDFSFRLHKVDLKALSILEFPLC